MIRRKTIKTEETESLKFVPLGGLEEVGRNCMFFEYQDEIVVIDAGLQFPEETTPGIDYIIPNVNYLQQNKNKVRALIITHGHYDHIGAIPYIIQKIGNPPIYAAPITAEIIKRRQEDFPNQPKLNVITTKHGDKIKLGQYFEVEFFDLDHTIPDTLGLILKTPAGNMVHVTDFRFDYDENEQPVGLPGYEKIGKLNIHTLLMESTSAWKEGRSLAERVVIETLEELFKAAQGRIIVGTFASMITRLGEIVKVAQKLKRKVFVSGFSMKTNLQIAQNLGYLKFEKGALLPIEELHKYKDDKVLIICTGAQGEPQATLMRVANGEHKYIKAKEGDTFVFSSSVIVGNEYAIQILKDNLTRQGAKVYQSMHMDIHASGHGPKEDMKLMLNAMRPRFFIPVHGFYFMRAANKENALECGLPKNNILLPDNGQVIEITPNSTRITDKNVDAYQVMVDGLGVGDVGEVVLRDRRILAEEGMLVLILTLDKEKGHLLKKPDIISRGFIYLKEQAGVVEEIRSKIRHLIERIPRHQHLDDDYVKSLLREQLGTFIYNKTHRRPMILPVVIEV